MLNRMTKHHFALVVSTALLALGCATSHEIVEPPVVEIVTVPATATFATPPTTLESCLESGGALTEVASIDNDDVREHGALLTFAVADDRRLAVSSEDGTIKVWTLDGFLNELDPGAFLYGVEVDRPQVADLTFHDGQIVAGDVQGLVSMWSTDGFPEIVGGTDPDVAIVAVAVDSSGGRVAHADERASGNVMVRALADTSTFGPLEITLENVRDLAFLPDGRLLIAGGGSEAGLELRGSEDPTRVEARFAPGLASGFIDELAVSEGAETLAYVAADAVGVLDDSLNERWRSEGVGLATTSVAISRTGRALFTVGDDGALRVWSGADGATLDTVAIPEPVTVRVDLTGELVVVGSRDGVLRAFQCQG